MTVEIHDLLLNEVEKLSEADSDDHKRLEKRAHCKDSWVEIRFKIV